MVETRNVHFLNNIFDICFKTEGCIVEEATIRYVLIGHIASVLHFHWTVESISIWKIHKTAKSIGRSNQISGGVMIPLSFEQTYFRQVRRVEGILLRS